MLVENSLHKNLSIKQLHYFEAVAGFVSVHLFESICEHPVYVDLVTLLNVITGLFKLSSPVGKLRIRAHEGQSTKIETPQFRC